ncbi:MAG: hypothetical protein JJE39_14505, partial [Vicinamibacteria bacterium]|nr:hypothetical protein [Vicinamibacteria bacterium]
MARSMVAAVVACLILAATETVAAYPRPSSASWNFFTAAFTTYLPFLALGAALLAAAVPRRGISLWF